MMSCCGLVMVLGLLLAGCGTTTAPMVQEPTFTRTVDLSHVVREDVPYQPEEPVTQLQWDSQGVFRELCIGAQTGTFLQIAATPDADLRTIDLLSPDDLVVPVVVIDVRDQAQDSLGYRFSVDELRTWEYHHGRVPAGAFVLLVTGWDVRWGEADAYLDPEGAGLAATPAFGATMAAMLFEDRGVVGLGIDAPATLYYPVKGHRLLLANLTNLEQLPATGATLVIGTLKLQATQSSPARVIALVP